ncbi:MAG TPA: HAD-IC family P-type ATPase [Candidatus Paceibacterota bacterium]
MEKLWHAASLEKVFGLLESKKEGLSEIEAQKRIKKYGHNTLPEEKPYSRLRLFLSQFESPLVLILAVAGGVSLYLGHYSDSIFIIIVLLINTTVGFYQENKANSSLLALKKMVKISARVFRDGNLKEIDSSDLVPGDIVTLNAGDKVPCDGRIIESKDLKIDESTLTGEWLAVKKSAGETDEKTVLADRSNMVYLSTIVESGEALIIVTQTGRRAAIGKIVLLLRDTKERKTPLQKQIAFLSKVVGLFIIIIVSFVVIVGSFGNETFVDIFITSLALAVSATPAGLLPAVTVILVFGMRRVLEQNGLVRKLAANETLGAITVICTDKTGTLTEGKMQVSHIMTGTRELLNDSGLSKHVKDSNGLEAHIIALKIATLGSDAFVENPEDEFHEWIVRGKPTDRALLIAGMHAGLNKKELDQNYRLLEKINFNSDAKYSASLRMHDGQKLLFVLGAPEVVIERSQEIYLDGRREKLDSREFIELNEKLITLTSQGLRVVAAAMKEVREDGNELSEMVNKLTLVGFIALKDPLRKDAKHSIITAKEAGIRVVIITGDHALTAKSVANEIGIPADKENILEGKELEELSSAELREKCRNVSIFARVAPNHKLQIIDALQKNGEIVAMIGDGINDTPALKMADVGVCLGSGSDIAKEVSDVVLLDDNFKTVIKAIEQGRVIFQNIRKVFVYLVADDFSELFLFLMAMVLGLPLPLLAAQILWINLVEDGFPAVALTTEQETKGVMEEKPRNPKEGILNKPMKNWMASIFFITGIAAFMTFFILLKLTGDLERTRSVVFALMALDSLVFAFSVRSLKRSIFRTDIFSNTLLVGGAFIGLILLFAALYLPMLQKILHTHPLIWSEWAVIVSVSLIEILFIEWFKKRNFSPQ